VPVARLSDIQLCAGTCALLGVEDPDEGAIGLSLDDFEVPIPESFRSRYDAWFKSIPDWKDAKPDFTEIHAVGRALAHDLAVLIGQPVSYTAE
jgi:hypothetical protein